jgi:hypothetical protein
MPNTENAIAPHRHRALDGGRFVKEYQCRDCGIAPCPCGRTPPHRDERDCDVPPVPTSGRRIKIGAPDPTGIGPWVGVPRDRHDVCAVEACTTPGEPQRCLYDGAYHHHGCVHYDCPAAEATNHGLTFRPNGWAWLCAGHYAVLVEAYQRKYGARAVGHMGQPR